ncbi:hypothetical protein EX30DRAFT_390176 [Ascodesmis nigricans]|uniref:Uncharacterized protein n=1 Tax=Ascodesmis nigricans TaxID=341454 RepID=A0A4S2MHW5_9PEZI|nr:hypothetical protein EX30DRAFT_390176 [Ascodesmis nigricans]
MAGLAVGEVGCESGSWQNPQQRVMLIVDLDLDCSCLLDRLADSPSPFLAGGRRGTDGHNTCIFLLHPPPQAANGRQCSSSSVVDRPMVRSHDSFVPGTRLGVPISRTQAYLYDHLQLLSIPSIPSLQRHVLSVFSPTLPVVDVGISLATLRESAWSYSPLDGGTGWWGKRSPFQNAIAGPQKPNARCDDVRFPRSCKPTNQRRAASSTNSGAINTTHHQPAAPSSTTCAHSSNSTYRWSTAFTIGYHVSITPVYQPRLSPNLLLAIILSSRKESSKTCADRTVTAPLQAPSSWAIASCSIVTFE